MRYFITINSDDDFLFKIGNLDNTTYCNELLHSKDEAISFLKSFSIIESFDWVQNSNTFTRYINKEPKDHWFLEYISKGIVAIEKDKDFVLGGNQTLEIEIL